MKIELEDTLSGHSITKINANFQLIEDALNDLVLYRDNPVGDPNQMESLLDMNSQRIINLPAPVSANDAARLQDVVDAISGLPNASMIAFTPAGTIAATTVQGAIEEVSSELNAEILSLLANFADTLDATKGSNLVGYNPALTYTLGVGRFLNYVFGRSAAEIALGITPTHYQYPIGHVRRYGALGNYDGTNPLTANNDTTAFQNAIYVAEYSSDPGTYGSNSPSRGVGQVIMDSGGFVLKDVLVATKRVHFQGEGQSEFSSGTRIIQFTSNKNHITVNPIASGSSISFEKIVFKTLSGVTGTGDMIKINRTTANCNSQRYIDCTFGPPQRYAVNIEAGDDIVFSNCLWDVGSLAGNSAIVLGDNVVNKKVTNVSIVGCNFFDLYRGILPYQVDGLVVSGCRIYTDQTFDSTYFIDGENSMPMLFKGVTLTGNKVSETRCFIAAHNAIGLTVAGNTCQNMGSGAGETYHQIKLTGTCVGVSITGNALAGQYDAASHVDTQSAVSITGFTFVGNTVINEGGTGPAVTFSNAIADSCIADNVYNAFTTPNIGGKWSTTGAPFAPGLIAGGATGAADLAWPGARAGDFVSFNPGVLGWPIVDTFSVKAYVNVNDVIRFAYTNLTAGGLTPAAHDWTVKVTR